MVKAMVYQAGDNGSPVAWVSAASGLGRAAEHRYRHGIGPAHGHAAHLHTAEIW